MPFIKKFMTGLV